MHTVITVGFLLKWSLFVWSIAMFAWGVVQILAASMSDNPQAADDSGNVALFWIGAAVVMIAGSFFIHG